MTGQFLKHPVVAALASLFMPGLGQFIQGRYVAAGVQFLLASALWIWGKHGGWEWGAHFAVHLYSGLDAGLYQRLGRFVGAGAGEE